MLGAFTLGWAVIYANRTSMYPLLSVIAANLGLSSTQIGFLTSSYFFLYVLMQIPAGVAGDRFGLKRVLLVMFAVATLGMLGLGLAGTSFAALLFFTALHGLGAGAYYPASFGTILQVVSPQRRGLSSAIISMGMALGLFAGLAVSGPVFSYLDSYRAPFLLLCLPSCLMLAYFYRSVPNVKGATAPGWAEYKAVLADKQLWLINVISFCGLYGFWVAIAWGPTFLKLERGFSLNQSGLYTGLVAIMAVPAALLWGRLSDAYGRKPLALFVLPASALVLFCLSQVTDHTAILATLLTFGLFSNSALTPIIASWTADITSARYPGQMGAAIGVLNCVTMSSAIFAPVVSGYLRDVTGSLIPAIIAGSVVMGIGSFLVLLLPHRAEGATKKRQA
jgi:MFS family permease